MSTPDERDICVGRVVVMSGIRPAGRTVDQTPHGRSSHGLLYIWSGVVQFCPIGKPELRAGDGELLIIPKGCRYTMQYAAAETTFVLVNCELLRPDGKAASISDEIRVLARDTEERRIAGIMAKLELCSAAESSSATFRRKELLYRLFSMIFEETAPFELAKAKYANIIPGVLLLQQTYLESIPITELAAACRISVSSFRSLFTEQYGMSPVQYRNRLRINRARSILSEGSCTVSEAAYASGFDNIGYFCRYYKKITGETPRETQLKSL